MSGSKPGISFAYRLCAPPSATRKPVITSSNTSSAPCCVHSSRSVFMKGTLARTKFMLPAIGSIITQAMSRAVQREGLLELREVVVLEHQRVLHHLGRHAGAGRVAEGGQARAGLDQQRVGMAVVAALELDDLAAAGGAARQADRAHRRLGARADQAHLLHGRHQLRGSPRPARSRARSARRRRSLRRPPSAPPRAPPGGRGPGSSGPRSRCSRCSACRRRPSRRLGRGR